MAPDALQPEPIDLKLRVPWNQRQLAHGPTTTHKHTVAANGSPTLSEFRWVDHGVDIPTTTHKLQQRKPYLV
jgi:hypothetical protein